MFKFSHLRAFKFSLTLLSLFVLYQNCSDINLIPITEVVEEIDPGVIENTRTPDAPYIVQTASRLLYSVDVKLGALGKIQVRDMSNNILSEINGSRIDQQVGKGLVLLSDQDGDGIEDFAFSNYYNNIYGLTSQCLQFNISNIYAPCETNASIYYRTGDVVPMPSVDIHRSSGNAERVKRVEGKDRFIHGDQILEVGDLDNDGKKDLLLSYHFPEWFAVSLSGSSEMSYLQIEHGKNRGFLSLARDVNRDGVNEVWHTSYAPYSQIYTFNLMDIKNKRVLAKTDIVKPTNSLDHSLEMASDSTDVDNDGYADYFILEEDLENVQNGLDFSHTHNVFIHIISGKKLVVDGNWENLHRLIVPKSTGAGSTNKASLKIGDFHQTPGLEFAVALQKQLYIYNVMTQAIVLHKSFEGFISLEDKADLSGDELDDLLIHETERLMNRAIILNVNTNQNIHSFAVDANTNLRVRAFLRESNANSYPGVLPVANLLASVPTNDKCARNGSGLQINPVGWVQSGHTWLDIANSYYLSTGFPKQFALQKQQYISVPVETQSLGRKGVRVVPGNGLDPAMGISSYEGIYVTISECPGDFRAASFDPAILATEPTLSPKCRKTFVGEVSDSLFSASKRNPLNDCIVDKDKTYFLNIIQTDPTVLFSPGDNSNCPNEYCGIRFQFVF
jgi:hypothetical protein